MASLDIVSILEISAVSILAYVIGAAVHIGIDQWQGARLVDRYFRTTKEQIIGPVRAELLEAIDEVMERIPSEVQMPELQLSEGQIAKEFESFLRSDPGKLWAAELADVVAGQFEQAFVSRTTSLAGNVARSAQSELVRLIDGSVDLGNPVANGVWMMIPRESKLKLYNRIASVLRKGGLALVATDEPMVLEGESSPAESSSTDLVKLPDSWQR